MTTKQRGEERVVHMAKTTLIGIARWRDHVKIHPAAELFPAMTEDELRVLGEDIRDNAMVAPLVFWRPTEPGQDVRALHAAEMADWHDPNLHGAFLIDGRSRLDACELVGLPTLHQSANHLSVTGHPVEIVYEHEVDPFDFVVSANIRRRHLTPEQKRELIAACLQGMPERSDRDIGELVKADHKTVGKVRRQEIAKGAIAAIDATVGSDGRTRRTGTPKQQARAAQAPVQPTPTPTLTPTSTPSPTPPDGNDTSYLDYLNRIMPDWPDSELDSYDGLSGTCLKLTQAYGAAAMVALAKMVLNCALDDDGLSDTDREYLSRLSIASYRDGLRELVDDHREQILACRAAHPDWSLGRVAWEVQCPDGVVDRVFYEADFTDDATAEEALPRHLAEKKSR